MRTIFYDDEPLHAWEPRSIFLAGPTARDTVRTPWRAKTIELLEYLRPEGIVIVPEFRNKKFDREYFETLPLGYFTNQVGCLSRTIPNMKRSSQNILDWETAGLDNCDVLLVWMPFSDELPGKTTRSEVSRAIERAELCRWLCQVPKLVLGTIEDADSGGRIRYDAYRYDIPVFQTLEECCHEAARLTKYYDDKEVPPWT